MSLFASLSHVGRPVAYYPRLARFFGSVNAAILFAQLHYWHGRGSDSELGIYKTSGELEEETGLSYREQATARAQLRDGGYLVETNRRLEHKVYFKLVPDVIDAAYEVWTKAQFPNDENAFREMRKTQPAKCGKRRTRTAKSSFDELRKAQSDISTETTHKTTTPISAKADAVAEPMRVTDKKGVIHEIPAELRYPGDKAKTHDAWCAYAIAYHGRYGAWPMWNAMVAAQMSKVIDRVGAERAARVAYHYVAKVQEPFVLNQMHPVKLLLSDAEKWATQCQTGAAPPTPPPAQSAHKFAGAHAAIFEGVRV
ncbi:hypothetical protein KW843_22840 [Acidovorax sp. sif1233]|uniref:hypothetical protein n=1 Tax=Acidovorax sp. sif1233 TaxID=2854792 RepID=UPI001C451938|nr:hypothetical protein [Acidovorax sp. sif1233]MBV7457336.1 hypothetical protein [Acidovorax sp. sif1233]